MPADVKLSADEIRRMTAKDLRNTWIALGQQYGFDDPEVKAAKAAYVAAHDLADTSRSLSSAGCTSPGRCATTG